jgi:GT2 family glycosyltransferase
MVKFLQEHKVEEGTVNPWGNTKCIMRKYPISELPSVIFELPRVKKFLLGEEKFGLNFSTEIWNTNKSYVIEQKKPIPVLGTAVVNGVHWLRRMIDSIDYPVDELFIVNNNGRGELHTELEIIANTKYQYIKKVTISHMPSNIGCGGAWNLIIRSYLNAPYWIITNPDVAYSPGFLETMVREAKDRKVGMVHCSPCFHDQGSFECFLLKDWVVQSHGLFDENFYPAYVEDCDYIMRLVLQPVKRVYMNVPYLHGEESYETTGSQVLRTEPALKEKIDRARYLNEHTYMEQKWCPKWRYPEPWPYPFNNPNFPISYTTYDLNFCREKSLGF